jgi:hypothetical protein
MNRAHTTVCSVLLHKSKKSCHVNGCSGFSSGAGMRTIVMRRGEKLREMRRCRPPASAADEEAAALGLTGRGNRGADTVLESLGMLCSTGAVTDGAAPSLAAAAAVLALAADAAAALEGAWSAAAKTGADLLSVAMGMVEGVGSDIACEANKRETCTSHRCDNTIERDRDRGNKKKTRD